jgi:hypothetical protein
LAISGKGLAVVPIIFRSKKPVIDEWQDAPNYFNGGKQNIGVILGGASGGFVDLDLDCPEAIAAAP